MTPNFLRGLSRVVINGECSSPNAPWINVVHSSTVFPDFSRRLAFRLFVLAGVFCQKSYGVCSSVKKMRSNRNTFSWPRNWIAAAAYPETMQLRTIYPRPTAIKATAVCTKLRRSTMVDSCFFKTAPLQKPHALYLCLFFYIKRWMYRSFMLCQLCPSPTSFASASFTRCFQSPVSTPTIKKISLLHLMSQSLSTLSTRKRHD